MAFLIFIVCLIIAWPAFRFFGKVIGIALFMALRIGALLAVVAFIIMFCLGVQK